MITQITSANRDKYLQRFAEAVKEFEGTKKININSLEDYFYYLPELIKLTKENDERYGRYYTMLPLGDDSSNGEGYFYIDANSRTIKVPDAFRRNGIGVQGDHGAETIYFYIDRYFDHEDLNNCDIYIQWKHTDSNNMDTQGVSPDYVRDIKSDKNHLIFGWKILDDITLSGTITFSIRFVRSHPDPANPNDRIIDYSFSTLNQVATINQALDYEIKDLVDFSRGLDDEYSYLLSLIQPAQRTNVTVAYPEYRIMLLDNNDNPNDTPEDANNHVYDLGKGNEYTYNLFGNTEGEKVLFWRTQASTSDLGTLTYDWYKNGIKIDNTDLLQTVYTQTQDTAPQSNKLYYDINGNLLTITSNDKTWDAVRTDNNLLEDAIITEKMEQLQIIEAGKYQSKVTNTVVQDNMEAGTTLEASQMVESGILAIPGPTLPVLNTNTISKIIDIDNNSIVITPEISNEDEKTVYNYKWTQQNNSEETLSTERTLTLNTKENDGNYINNVQGAYNLNIEGIRNNTKTTDSITSNDYIVTYPPITIQTVHLQENGSNIADIFPGRTYTAKLILSEGIGYNQLEDYTTYTYEWYNAASVLLHTGETFTIPEKEQTSSIMIKAINNYNGQIAEKTRTLAIQ